MQKNLKISFILLLVFSSMVVAFEQIVSLLHGFSLAYIAEVIISAVLLYFVVRDVPTSSRMKDMYGISFLFLVWETFLFFSVSIFSWYPKALYILNKIVVVLALGFIVFILFRLYCELTHKRFSFIEVVLGNERRAKKASKELSNGSLAEKPKRTKLDTENKVIENNPAESSATTENNENNSTADTTSKEEMSEE